MKVGIGVSLASDPVRAAREAVRAAKKSVPRPAVSVVFGSVTHDQKRLHRALCAELDPNTLIGGSSYAEMTSAGAGKGHVAVMLLDLGGKVEFADAPIAPDPRDTGLAMADSLGPGPRPKRSLGLVFTSVSGGRDNRMLEALRERLGPVPLFGGMCVGDYDLGLSHKDFWKNWQYCGGRLTNSSARIALLEVPEGVDLAFGFGHGWSPLGPESVITKADGNVAREIDGVSAVDYYCQLVGGEDGDTFYEKMIQRYGVAMSGGEGVGRLKLPVACDFERGTVTFYPAEDIEGAKVRLLQSSRRGLLGGAREAAQRCREALGGRAPEAVFVVSCCTRSAILHSRTRSELDVVSEAFGPDVPVFGFYSGGEIVPLASRFSDALDASRPELAARYHATTVGILAFAGARRARRKASAAPRRKARAPERADDPSELRALLAQSEATLDSTEDFLANLSRKSTRDAERLKSQTEVIRRYTPHQVFARVGENAAKGVYELADAEFNGAFMFMDVKGFTAYSEGHKPAEVVAAVNRIFDPCVKAIYAAGGDVDKFIGDCIFAAFPSPRSAAEAARTMLEIVSRQKEQGSPFEVRIGVNAGRAVRANVGSDARREYTFIGDAVNIAQRLESNAEPGHALLAEAVYESAKDLFPSAARKVLHVKNRAEPVVAYQS